MTKHFLRGESFPVILPENLFNAAALLSHLDRDQIAGAIEVLVALMDMSEVNPDIEMNGDELDGHLGEDDYHPLGNGFEGPGCPIADPGGCEHDGREPVEGF